MVASVPYGHHRADATDTPGWLIVTPGTEAIRTLGGMEFRVLGPVEVGDGNRKLALGGFRQRLVLGVLLLYPNRSLSTDWLVDAVWGEAPPRTARKTLQVYISRLRGLLGSDMIEATEEGYLLRLDPVDLDVHRFEELAAEGHRLLAQEPSAATRALRRALAMWRGMPWGEIGDQPALQAEAQRLRQRRLEVLQDRITGELEIGHAARVVGELEGLVEEHPWQEGFRAQLMLALYRSGRQSDALRAFQETRRFLGEELGIDPSPELRELEEKILLQDPAIAGPDTEIEPEDWSLARNPYKGLRAFRRNDEADFFGRSHLVHELAKQVEGNRFVAVVGASGAGKSSVVMAGLVPHLPPDRWVVAPMVPGRDPFAAARAAIQDAVPGGATEDDSTRGDDLDLLRAVQSAIPERGPRLLLMIDQFEELLHQVTDEIVRARFVRNLVEAIEDPSARLTVLIALRADYLDRALSQPLLGELIGGATVGVRPLRPAELEAAAARPAERAGVHMEPELIAELVGDMTGQPGALPQFQYVLTELFEARTGPVLHRASYRRLGGLKGALVRRAEETYADLDPEVQAIARQVFMRLVTVDPALEAGRRRVDRASLESIDPAHPDVKVVLDAFDEARLLTFDRSPVTGQPTVEVAHEALLREWPRMRSWLDAARQDLYLHSALVREVAEWENSVRDPDYLLTGSRLARYEDWKEQAGIDLTAQEEAFIDESVVRREELRAREDARQAAELRLERRSARRLRTLVVVVSIAALVAAGLTLLAVNRIRETAAKEREARSRELASASRVNLDNDPELAILLALESINVTRAADEQVARESVEALHEATNAHRLVETASGGFDVAYLPDGTVFSGGQQARLWSPATGREQLVGLGETLSVAASSDGSMVATGSGRGYLAVWDASSGDRVQSFTRDGGPAHDGFIRDVVFSSDGSLLASASGGIGGPGDQTVRVWDVASGAEVVSVESPDGAMWSFLGETPQLAFHPDGAHLAITGFRDEAARILNVATGEWDQSLVGAGSPARGVRYLADGDRIATSAAHGSITLWDTATASHLFSITLESSNVRLQHFDVSPDGSQVAATSDDGSIRVWNLLDGRGSPAIRLHASDIPMGIAFSPDGRQLAGVTGDELEIWDVTAEGRGEVIALNGEGSMTAFSLDGSLLAARQGSDIVIFDTSTWNQEVRLDHDGSSSTDAGPRGVAWSPDGDRIATTAGDDVPIPGPGRIQVWSVDTGSLLRTLSDVSQPQGDIAFGAGGRIAVALCERSADGLSWGSPAKVWDADTGDELFVVPAADCGDAVDLDPAGRLLATQIEEREEVQLWNLDTKTQIGAVPHAPGSGGGVRFSPDGSHLVTAGIDWTAKIWDVTTFEQVLVLEGHRGAVTQAVWSPDGEMIVTGATDGTVRLWDAETGDVRLVLSGHEGGLVSLSVSPDGRVLASSGVDGALRVWAIDLDELIGIAESRLSRTPTEAECEAYRFEVCSE